MGFGEKHRQPAERPITVGVIADTHVPDRSVGLHPSIVPLFQSQEVVQILHAGDICAPGVLEELEQVAPVVAVRGNRDWSFRDRLPWLQSLTIGGMPVALMHGHGTWWDYLRDKWQYMLFGYDLERYLPILERPLPEARVIVFGHTHRSVNRWRKGRLLFNPGTAGMVDKIRGGPSVGLLKFFPDGKVEGEIHQLNGYRLNNRQWEPTGSH